MGQLVDLGHADVVAQTFDGLANAVQSPVSGPAQLQRVRPQAGRTAIPLRRTPFHDLVDQARDALHLPARSCNPGVGPDDIPVGRAVVDQ